MSELGTSLASGWTPEEVVRRATIAAGVVGGAAGALPVPAVDVAAIAPIQAMMIVGISRAHGLPACEREATTPVALLLSSGTMSLGRAAAEKATAVAVARITARLTGKLVRFVPLVGPAVGAAVSGTIAILTTKALGETWSRVCSYATGHELKELDRFLESDEGQLLIKILNALGMAAMLSTVKAAAAQHKTDKLDDVAEQLADIATKLDDTTSALNTMRQENIKLARELAKKPKPAEGVGDALRRIGTGILQAAGGQVLGQETGDLIDHAQGQQ